MSTRFALVAETNQIAERDVSQSHTPGRSVQFVSFSFFLKYRDTFNLKVPVPLLQY